ncbi:acyl-CoA N-acyltransferase, partial [Macrolepiota fuliginosa MF-IS2]
IPSHDIIVVSSRDELQQCFDVRVEVFHHEQGFPLDLELDELATRLFYHYISAHILLRLTPSLKPIGTIRGYVVPGTTDTYKLTRLAILKEYRKYGFGRELVEALHTWIKAHSSGTTPLIPVPGFYSKFGYTPEGEEFIEDGDPHQKMVLRISVPT